MNQYKFILILLLIVLFFFTKTTFSNEIIANSIKKWEIGDAWVLNAELYSGDWELDGAKNDPQIIKTYLLPLYLFTNSQYFLSDS
jgi:hypothetical protein